MTVLTNVKELTYRDRLDVLRQCKLTQTEEKQSILGARDDDDWPLVLPPPEYRKVVQMAGLSGEPITQVLIDGLEMKTNHPNGDFYGPRLCGENFRRLLEAHPPFVDPMSSLAGAIMTKFGAYRRTRWNPDFDYSHLHAAQQRYQLLAPVEGMLHFCPDLAIGLDLGWGGLLAKIRRYRQINRAEAGDFYEGLEHVVLGMQNWIGRTAKAAWQMAQTEPDPQRRANLEEIAWINERLVSEPPRTFREVCQWIVWYLMAAHMYNLSVALGRLDVLLKPFYERDIAIGRLTDEEAVFHIACLLLHNPGQAQLGGPDQNGNDITHRISYLVLEAIDQLRVPANISVCVGNRVDPGLLRRGVEMQFTHKMGFPKFLGIDRLVEGMVKNGFPIEDARQRAYSGCHWGSIPGREYGMCDLVKLNFAAVFDVALREMMADSTVKPDVAELWRRFKIHLEQAIDVMVAGLHFRMEHAHQVFPELVLDLLCHGPVEKGLDASHGGVEFYNLGIDGAALATIADSFAAIETRIEKEGRMSWIELMQHLDNNWAGVTGERARLMMKCVPSYGFGGAIGDTWAKRIVQTFTNIVNQHSTDAIKLTPGLFSFSSIITIGHSLGATPNGRRAGEPISQGANPNPGFRQDGASTALAVAIASVQPGLGNTALLQLELDPGLSRDEEAMDKISSLIKTHFTLGGTQINLNVLDKAKVLEAHRDPSKHPDLIVRVTGFSAYFASLSPEFRQLIVDRIIAES